MDVLGVSNAIKHRLQQIADEIYQRVEIKVLVQVVYFDTHEQSFKIAPEEGRRHVRYESMPDRYSLFGCYNHPDYDGIYDDVQEYLDEIGIGARDLLSKEEWVG